MRHPLTKADMLGQLKRLHDLWPKYDADTDTFARLTNTFHDALNNHDAEAVEGVVSLWIRTGTRFPAPSQLLDLMPRWLGANRDSVPLRSKGQGCTVCGAEPRWAILATTHYTTKEEGTVERMIHPCIADLHPPSSPIIPYPPNFLRWAPPTETKHEPPNAQERDQAHEREARPERPHRGDALPAPPPHDVGHR